MIYGDNGNDDEEVTIQEVTGLLVPLNWDTLTYLKIKESWRHLQWWERNKNSSGKGFASSPSLGHPDILEI